MAIHRNDELQRLLATAERLVEQLRAALDQSTTTRSDSDATLFREELICVDDVSAGEHVFLHWGPRFQYVSRSSRPSNVLQSPGLADVVKRTYDAYGDTTHIDRFGTGFESPAYIGVVSPRVDKHLGIKAPITDHHYDYAGLDYEFDDLNTRADFDTVRDPRNESGGWADADDSTKPESVQAQHPSEEV